MKSIAAEYLKTIESIKRVHWMLIHCDRKVDWSEDEIMRRTELEIYRQADREYADWSM